MFYTKWHKWARKNSLILAGESGLTLVELLVVLALLSMVVGSAYQYFSFGYASWDRAAAESRAIQDARLAVTRLDQEVRMARKAMESTAAVVVSADHNQLDIYTDVITGDVGKPELVRYRLQSGSLVRGVSVPQGSQYPYTYQSPGTWETVVAKVANGNGNNLFSLDSSHLPRLVVYMDLWVNDAAAPLAQPLQVLATFTVRSREVAE